MNLMNKNQVLLPKNSFETNSSVMGDTAAYDAKTKRVWTFIKQSSIAMAEYSYSDLSEPDIKAFLKKFFSFFILQKLVVMFAINYFTI
jgi:hypothetical protein